MTARDVSTILCAERIRDLRDAYNRDRAALAEDARESIERRYPGGAQLVSGSVEHFFWHRNRAGQETEPASPLPRRDIEICFLMMLSPDAPSLFLAIHIYWGLLEGLEPVEMAEVMLFRGYYQGIATFNSGLTVMGKTLDVLKSCPSVLPMEVLDALVSEF